MTYSVRGKSGLIALAVVAVLGLAAGPAQAQRVPFRVTGGGTAPDGVSVVGADSTHTATGQATRLGRYSGDGVFNSLSFDPTTLSGTFEGKFTFVAANGDKLAFTYGDTDNGAEQAAEYQVFPADEPGMVYAVFVAEFNPVPSESTGRFRNVVGGSFTMIAVSDPFPLVLDEEYRTPAFDYRWDGRGWLEFGRGR